MAGASDYGVILMNMGGPWTLEEIEPYLQRVLSDRKMVRLPGGGLYQGLFARLVSRRRARKVRARYEAIGGGSPLLAETEVLAAALSARLSVPVTIAMRYSSPFARDAALRMSEAGVKRWVGVPLYPQYSTATTASSVEDLLQHVPEGVECRLVERHGVNAGYVESLWASIEAALDEPGRPTACAVLLTAHSIPESYTAAGDPYVAEVEETVGLLRERIEGRAPVYLAFQSAVRFGRWHGPSVEEVLFELEEQEVNGLIVQPLTFVSENLETRYDLDIVLRDLAADLGFPWYRRLAAPGREEAYVEGLAKAIDAVARREERDDA